MNHHLPCLLTQKTGKRWGTDSYVRAAVNQPANGALIFVHGFGGEAMGTWTDFPGLLGRMPKAAPYDVFYYGYDMRRQAGISAVGFRNFLAAIAEAPAFDVLNPSLPTPLGQRPRTFRYDHIVIAAHSLGAVVTRLALLQSKDDAGKPLPWLSKVRLVLFAPAHSGAKVIDFARGLLSIFSIGKLIETLVRARFQSLDDLDADKPMIRRLEADTLALLNSTDAAAAQCHRAWVLHAGLEDIVNVAPFAQDLSCEELPDADHMQVCKPSPRRLEPLEFLAGVLP